MANRKTALPEEVLLSVEKPARYIGAEYNSVMKNAAEVKVRFVMCFPDVYEIGMSYLGIQIIYDMLNKRPDVWCERVYSPWPDLDRVLREICCERSLCAPGLCETVLYCHIVILLLSTSVLMKSLNLLIYRCFTLTG